MKLSIWIDESIFLIIGNFENKFYEKNHNPMDIRHSGQQMMLELIKWNYWWPGIKEDIKKYVQGCIKYQQNKVQHQKKVGELHPLDIPQGL